MVSAAAPDITQEFTGLALDSKTPTQTDFALKLGQPLSVTTLISSTDDMTDTYPIFVQVKMKTGSIFVDGGSFVSSLDEIPLKDMYFGGSNFTQIVPTMLLFPYTFGDRAWHSNRRYASFSIDNPDLSGALDGINFPEYLRAQQTNNFHTTFSFTPSSLEQASFEVLTFFRLYPNLFTNGYYYNNEGIYDLYGGDNPENSAYLKDPDWLARFYNEQDEDVKQNILSLKNKAESLGISLDRILFFPWVPSPKPVLDSLKQNDIQAVVSVEDVPLGSQRPTTWDYGMYPAVQDYGKTPILIRQALSEKNSFLPFFSFIDRPIMFYIDGSEYTKKQPQIIQLVNKMNASLANLEWLSPEQILQRLYLEKVNDDGSLDVRLFANSIRLRNDAAEKKIFHISKTITSKADVDRVTINRNVVPFYFLDGRLLMDIYIPANSAVEISIYEK